MDNLTVCKRQWFIELLGFGLINLGGFDGHFLRVLMKAVIRILEIFDVVSEAKVNVAELSSFIFFKLFKKHYQ